jgi:hypothetical protein
VNTVHEKINRFAYHFVYFSFFHIAGTLLLSRWSRCRRGRDRMVVEFTTTMYLCNMCSLRVQILLRRGVLYTTLSDKICQWLAFSPGTSVSVTNKTDCHDSAEILLKVELNTIIIAPSCWSCWICIDSVYSDCAGRTKELFNQLLQ